MLLTAPRNIAMTLALLAWTVSAQNVEDRVLFVCEHGSVKSLIAAFLFDRAAEMRGLPFRAAARGVNPEDHVPPAIVKAMHGDGFEVEAFRPRGLQKEDLGGAARVIAIGVDLKARADEALAPIRSWDDIPPASADYAAARAALQRHIDALLDELQEGKPAP